jgi:hypothetical protein
MRYAYDVALEYFLRKHFRSDYKDIMQKREQPEPADFA